MQAGIDEDMPLSVFDDARTCTNALHGDVKQLCLVPWGHRALVQVLVMR